jgi:hypothetical protein
MEQITNEKKDSLLEIDKDLMKERIMSSGKWFFIISLLSLMNVVFYFFKADRYFVLGMGIPFFIDGILENIYGLTKAVGLIANILFIGYFAFMGYLTINQKLYGLVAGLSIYLIDTVIFIVFRDWLGIAFHFIALFMISRGLYNLLKIRKLDHIIVN